MSAQAQQTEGSEEKIFFSTNSTKIRTEFKRVLKDVGSFLAKDEKAWGSLVLKGHADQRGTAEHNMELSRKRSESVRSILASDGANADKMTMQAFGFTQPLNPGNNPKAWSANRRVELVFKDVKDPDALEEKLNELSKYEVPGAKNE